MPESVAGIIKKGDKYLLGKRKPGGSIGGKWEFPGGKVENGESLENALIREFQEELGCDIKIKKFIVTENFTGSDHSFLLSAFYIEIDDTKIKYFEHDEFNWFTLVELKQLKSELADSDKLLLKSI